MAGANLHPNPLSGYSEDYPDPDDYTDGECGTCGGEGGYAVCFEDCCPHIYGEEGCDDPACWRVCPECRGNP